MQTFLFIILTIITTVLSQEIVTPTIYMPATNVYTKTADKNALYAASTSFIVYRVNYTRQLVSPTFSYTTTHTRKIRDIAVSYGQRYLATGGEDNRVQVVEIYPKTTKCTFFGNNQIRALAFHPYFEEILFVGILDDGIQKWNITNCSKISGLPVGGIVTSMVLNLDGSEVYYGTFQGHVGKADQDLTTYSILNNAHRFMVKYMFALYQNFYVSIGQDSRMILWNSGSSVANFTTLTSSIMINCFPFGKQVDKDKFSLIGCLSSNYKLFTYRVDNTSIALFTSHGVYSYVTPLNWIDGRDFQADQQVWTYSYGTSMLVHKLRSAPGTACTPHIGNDGVTRTCRFCGYLLLGCHFCDNQTVCKTCGEGTYLTGSVCTRCPIACTSCSSATLCSTCAVGFYQSGSSCLPQTYQAGCYEYSGSTQCAVVASGFYKTSGSLSRSCSSVLTGCVQCTKVSTPACTACNTGYFPNSTFCSLCSTFMTGCLACNNKDTCITCSVAFKYNGAFVQCGNCHYSCHTCEGFYDTCTVCALTSNRTLIYSKCPCDAGFYDTGIAACRLCRTDLQNCFQCNSATVCLTCHTNYFFITNGSKTQCAQCHKFCQDCNGTYTNCTSCNQAVHHRILVGSSCVCQTGFYNVGGDVPCLDCSLLIDGCVSCSNQSFCTVCNVGYYLEIVSSTVQICKACPYYCSDCGVDVSSNLICNSCPASTHRTLIGDMCECDYGYFDDNRTLVCQKCQDVIANCLECSVRKKCITCAPGMFSDPPMTLCAPCSSTCLTCGTYFDTCASCDPWSNRVLVGDKCVCQASTFQINGVCTTCASLMPSCNSCTNSVICTGCAAGYILMPSLKGCINCEQQINGCLTCTSATNCTACKTGFSLINGGCRCQMDQFTSVDIWGSCNKYTMDGLKSGMGMEIKAYQHINNSLSIFIRFRTINLFTLNSNTTDSISVEINGQANPISFKSINNNHITITTQLSTELQNVQIKVLFKSDVFYSQDLLTLKQNTFNLSTTRYYRYSDDQIDSYQTGSNVLWYMFYALKWIFLAATILGLGHWIFPFVVIIQIMPLFLMMELTLPASIKMLLDSMLTFQNKSVLPMFTISSNFLVEFPPISYDYYGFYDFILLSKIGDILLILFMVVITKFDDGIVRMFPLGQVRRYLYQSLVMRGYSSLSFCILSFQPSFILLAGAYLSFTYFESGSEIFNYCCCVFVFGFYLAYNFNHASNLNQAKLMKNIDDEHCFMGINSQEVSSPKIILFVLATDFWLIGSFHLVSTFVYFVVSILLLFIRLCIHIKPVLYLGKIQFGLRVLQHLCILGVYVIMFLFYLSEDRIYLTISTCKTLGLWATALILAYMLFVLVQKIIFKLKIQTDYIKSKVVEGENGEMVVFENAKANDGMEYDNRQQQDDGLGNRHFLANNTPNKYFSTLDFRSRVQEDDESSSHQLDNLSFFEGITKGSKMNIDQNMSRSSAFFDKNGNITSREVSKKDIKYEKGNINTSKYAKNHLELRYKTQTAIDKPKNRAD